MDQTKIWDYFQNNEEVSEIDFDAQSRHEAIAKRIAPEMHVLNIGVGHGGLEAILQGKGSVVSSLDPSQEVIENLRRIYGLGARAQVSFSQLMPFAAGQFDVVVMSEIMEHRCCRM